MGFFYLSISLRKKYKANINMSINFIYALCLISKWQIPTTCIINKTNTFLKSKPQKNMFYHVLLRYDNLDTSVFSLSTTIEVENVLLPVLKCQRFILPKRQSREALRWSALETTGPFQSVCISAVCFALRFMCFCSIDPMLSTTASFGILQSSLRAMLRNSFFSSK